MKKLYVLMLAVLAAGSSWANSFVTLAEETGLPLPAGWSVVGSTDSFPVAFLDTATTAHLLIFRTILPPDERIAGTEDFRISVNRVIDSVVLQLPEALLLTSTGEYTRNRAEFVVEFQTIDSVSGEPLHHRLTGILYRHPEGYQILFSQWAQASQATYEVIREDLEMMQAGFRYDGPQEERVFAATTGMGRWAVVLVVGIAAVYFVLRQRRRQGEPVAAGRVAIWRCSCGRANHGDNETCRTCGHPRPEKTRTR